jgi:prepilin-type N-terminal cleavage/methylation domain-containing protein
MRRRHAGYSVIEILLVVGIIGILTVIATPTFLGYYQGAQLRVAAEEVAAFLNQGRQLAIVQNGSICVHSSSTAMHYRQGTCAGTTWTGPGTDASGSIAVPAGITLSTTADPIFNYVGGSTTGATYTITHTQPNTLVHVVVALSGRVSITP